MENKKKVQLIHFNAGEKDYAVELNCVREVIRMVSFTPVSELPDFVVGVINVRGEILPVIDFMRRAGLGYGRKTLRSRILIMTIKKVNVGMMVDRVREVIEIDPSAVSNNTLADVVLDPKYIKCTFIQRDRMVIWVDIEKVLTDREYSELEKGLEYATS
ncbi:chemotaxis protein CheW [bacterium]|nr:chemotaxis protein CheW [bacterium]